VCIEVLVGSGVSIPTSTTITIESRVESSGTIVFLLPSTTVHCHCHCHCPLCVSLYHCDCEYVQRTGESTTQSC
jgi:hypothetical protein